MATWLVTGAAGFVGSHLCERLLAHGEDVAGVDRLDGGSPALARARLDRLAAHPGFRLEAVDLNEPGAAERLVAHHRPRTVVHLAARTGVRGSAAQPVAYTTDNVVATVALLEACRRAPVGHVLYASSSSVYGDAGAPSPAPAPGSAEDGPADRPLSLYAATKRAVELVAHSYGQLYGLPTTGLRLFTVYGPRGRPDMAYYRFAEAIAAGRPVDVYGDGSARRDFTYVDDVVEAVLAVAARPPAAGPGGVPWAVHNVGRGRSETVARLLGLLEELLEARVPRRHHPAAPGDAEATLADTRSLAAATGFTPSVSLDEGLERFVAWYLPFRAAGAAGGAPPCGTPCRDGRDEHPATPATAGAGVAAGQRGGRQPRRARVP